MAPNPNISRDVIGSTPIVIGARRGAPKAAICGFFCLVALINDPFFISNLFNIK